MKKFLLTLIIILLLFWAGVLLLISNPLSVTAVTSVKAPAVRVNDFALDTANWSRWWPTRQTDDYHYSIVSRTPFSTRLLAQAGSDTFTSEILVLPATQDSALVQWSTVLPTGINPFARLQQYRRATRIKAHFQSLLDSLTAYLQSRRKMYGMDIAITQFQNPYMLNTKAQFDHYPTTGEVYTAVGKLRAFAVMGTAVAVDSPMVNVEPVEAGYQLRVALPVDKRLNSGGGIDFKQMVLGNTLQSTVTGGQHTVEHSLANLQNFINDHQLTSPAIPFQVWQTNRQQQPDSNKWVTRLYYPVF